MPSGSAAQAAVFVNHQRYKTTSTESKQGYISSALSQPIQRPFTTVSSGDVKPAWVMPNEPDSTDNPNQAASRKHANDEQRTRASAAHQRWISNIQDEEVKSGRTPDLKQDPNTSAANVVLYVGFALSSIGLIMTFVGLGDRGIQTQELKLIGPSLIGSGLLFCLLRIFFCSIQMSCNCCTRKEEDEKHVLEPPEKSQSHSEIKSGRSEIKSSHTETRQSSGTVCSGKQKISAVPKKMKNVKIHSEERAAEVLPQAPADPPPANTYSDVAGPKLALGSENVRAEVHQHQQSPGIEMAVIAPLTEVDQVTDTKSSDDFYSES